MGETNKETIELKEGTKEWARQEIETVREMIARFGNNDKEFDLIDDILERMEREEIEPKKAVENAYEIYNSKCEPQ